MQGDEEELYKAVKGACRPTMLSCVQWIPKGAVKKRPARMELSEAEMAMMKER